MLQISESSSAPCPYWGFPISAPMHMWGIPGSQARQVARLWKMHEPYSALPPFPLSLSSHSSAMCCGAAHLWTLLNGALVWPDSSPLLHFPSNLPAQPSDCHRKAVKTFHSFCIAALFLQQCLTIAIFYHTARFVYLLCCLHLPPHSLCCLFINRRFPPTRCMSKPGFLSSQHNMSCLC